MTSHDPAGLRAICEAAPKGPWTGDRIDGTVKYELLDANGDVVIRGCNGNHDPQYGIVGEGADEYLLAVSPDVVLSLIDALDAEKAEVARRALVLDQARTERDEARALNASSYCVWCGLEGPREPDHMLAHAKACPKSPVSAAVHAVRRLREAAVQWADRCDDDLSGACDEAAGFLEVIDDEGAIPVPHDADRLIEDMRATTAERDELAAEVAAMQGKPEGALPGWFWSPDDGPAWVREVRAPDGVLRLLIAYTGGGWGTASHGNAGTPRAAMRAAEAAARARGWL